MKTFLKGNFKLLGLQCECGEDLRLADCDTSVQTKSSLDEFGATIKAHCGCCGTFEMTLWGDEAKAFNDLKVEFAEVC